VRVAFWSAQAAALLRVAPPLTIWLASGAGVALDAGRLVSGLLALAGLAGTVSLGALWWSLRVALAHPRGPSPSTAPRRDP
ncbi:MAG TPA: hypothetical protein VFX49_12610, partial [Chloroflexota bacterium]|nr:hypothetical protein [Chloroflexota bacterium]